MSEDSVNYPWTTLIAFQMSRNIMWCKGEAWVRIGAEVSLILPEKVKPPNTVVAGLEQYSCDDKKEVTVRVKARLSSMEPIPEGIKYTYSIDAVEPLRNPSEDEVVNSVWEKVAKDEGYHSMGLL